MRRLVAWLFVAATVVLGACGDDDAETTGTSETRSSSSAPQATGSLDDAVAQLNEAIAAGDCEQIVGLTLSFLRPNASGDGPAEPGDPVRPEECGKKAPAVPLLSDIEGTTFDESEEYGGAAAISTGSGGKPVEGYDEWTVLWLVDRDGEWRQLSFFPADPQFEDDLPETVDPVAVTEQMVTAVLEDDCSEADQFMGEQIRLGPTPEKACESVAGGSIFAPAADAADEISYEELGRSRDYAFVGIDTGETYFVALLGTPVIEAGQPVQDEVQVADVVPLTDFEIVESEEEQE